jgi:hypothetical protein
VARGTEAPADELAEGLTEGVVDGLALGLAVAPDIAVAEASEAGLAIML